MQQFQTAENNSNLSHGSLDTQNHIYIREMGNFGFHPDSKSHTIVSNQKPTRNSMHQRSLKALNARNHVQLQKPGRNHKT